MRSEVAKSAPNALAFPVLYYKQAVQLLPKICTMCIYIDPKLYSIDLRFCSLPNLPSTI